MNYVAPQAFLHKIVPGSTDFILTHTIAAIGDRRQYIFHTLAFEALAEVPGVDKSVSIFVSDSNRLQDLGETRRILLGVILCNVRTAGQILTKPLYLASPFFTLEAYTRNFVLPGTFSVLSGWVTTLEAGVDPTCYL